MDFAAILKMLGVFLLASVKYLFSLPYALIIGLNYYEAILIMTIGGMAGFFFFYYLSEWVKHHFRRMKPVICQYMPDPVRLTLREYFETRRKKREAFPPRRFTRFSRTIVFLKMRFGFWGIIVTAPVLLSIPFGAFLLNRYYSRTRNVFAYMMVSILGWAAFFSVIVLLFPNLV